MIASIRIALCFAVVALLLALSRAVPAYCGTEAFTGSESGTTVTVPLDQDADSISDLSSVGTTAGSLSSQDGDVELGAFTGQRATELDPTSGTGCPVNPAAQQSCTLTGTTTTGCLFHRVGSSMVLRFSDGSLLIFGSGTANICVAPPPLPLNFTGTYSAPIVGGTGRFAGASGSITAVTHDGQLLKRDAAGHNFGWFESTLTGTLTLPSD